jgi:hypothetical protein
MPDSACAPSFVTMVTSHNIFEGVFLKVPKERHEMLQLVAELVEHLTGDSWGAGSNLDLDCCISTFLFQFGVEDQSLDLQMKFLHGNKKLG